MKYGICILATVLLATFTTVADEVLYSDDFDDVSIWPEYSGSAAIKEIETDYGKVITYNMSFAPTEDKVYSSVEDYGCLIFRQGSSSITAATSYMQFPDFKLPNGGNVTIVYGAGSTNKKLQLQEWNGTEWISGNYEMAITKKSSTWYTKTWKIDASAESKRLRLALVSSAKIFLASAKVTSTTPEITTSQDTVDITAAKGGNGREDISVSAGVESATAISATTESNILNLSADGLSYSKSVLLGTDDMLMILADASDLEEGFYTETVDLYAVGAGLKKTINVNLTVNSTTATTEIEGTEPEVRGGIGRLAITNAAGETIDVYNVSGQKVCTKKITDDAQDMVINRGIYIVKSGKKAWKLIVR